MIAPGFRLRTILIIIATLAVLMGLCQAIERSAPRLLPDNRTIGMTRDGITILTGRSYANGLITTTHLLIPLGLIVILIGLLTIPIILAVDHQSRRRNRAEHHRSPEVSRPDESSSDHQAGPTPRGEAGGRVG
jgi:hypothetical protein